MELPNGMVEWMGEECPVTFITAESQRFVEMYVRNKHANRGTGAPFVSAYGKLPARLVDAFVILDREDKAIEHAAMSAGDPENE